MSVLAVAVGVVGVAAYVNARYAADELGSKVMREASARIEQHVERALSVAESESAAAALLLQRGMFDPDDHEAVTEYFLQSMRANASLSYLSLGLETGKYYHVFRDRNGELSVLWLLPRPEGGRSLLEWVPLPEQDRDVVRDIADSKRTPPFERPYYEWAREATRASWTETYVFLGSGEELDIPGVTRATPLYDKGDALVGVLTADFDMLALSRYLHTLPVGERGFAFIIELRRNGSRRLIAHPRAVADDPAIRLALTSPAEDGHGREALDADDIDDATVRQLLAHIGSDPASIPTTMTPVSLSANGTRYRGGYYRLSGDDKPAWVLCTVIPENEIFGGVNRTARITLAVAAVGVLVALLLAVFLASRVSSRLHAIAADTKAIAEFHLDAKEPVRSRIDELAQLGTAMEEMKAGLRSFRKFVPADLVRSIVRSGEEAHLGGSRKEITLYFSDIAGFTSIAERLDPEQLVDLLAEYLGSMTTEMLKAGGTVDKYIGDAIMAFWDAPQPNPEHAAVACRTALANQRTLAALRAHWSADGSPPIRARIGLHTGEAIVGNFGCESRLDYTAIGDSVNLASRLEGINKIYGTEIIMSEATRALVGDEFVVRPLDKVAVKGKTEGIVIYELVGARDAVDDATRERIDVYTRGFDHYLAQRWAQAAAAFELALDADDPAARVLLARTREYQDAPPPRRWSGIYRAQSK